MGAGSNACPGEGDQGGRAKDAQNYQQRQGQDPNLSPNGQARCPDGASQRDGRCQEIRWAVSENGRIGKKLGPEYAALIDGLQDIDPESEVGQEISSTLDALDNLCGG
jgi:hypothetical protein